jgi:O-antigen/teichoic acid export membrane protein
LCHGGQFMRKRLLQGGAWAVLSRIVAIGLGLSLNALLARMLSPDEMGAYFLAISAIAISVVIGQMGLPQVVVRLAAESMSIGMPGRAKQAIQRSLLFVMVSGAGVALLFYLWIGDLLALNVFHSNGVRSIVSLISLSILIVSLQGVVTETYRGFHDIRAASLIGSVLTPAISVALLTLLWVNRDHASLQQIFVLTVASSVVALAVSGTFLRRKLINLHGSGSVAYKELVSIGWPLCVIQIAIFVATQADLWIVGAFLSERDAAIYGSVQKLLMLMTMTHSLVVAVAQSSVAELYAKGEQQKLERMIQGMAFVACVPSSLLLLVFVFFGGDILSLIFGEFYRAGSLPLLILGAGHFVGMLLGPAGMVLMMTGQQKQSMMIVVATSLATVVMAAMFARPFGVAGVAVAWGIGAIIYGLGTWWLAYRMLGVKTHAKYLPELWVWKGR